jgi:hypothetical protein
MPSTDVDAVSVIAPGFVPILARLQQDQALGAPVGDRVVGDRREQRTAAELVHDDRVRRPAVMTGIGLLAILAEGAADSGASIR